MLYLYRLETGGLIISKETSSKWKLTFSCTEHQQWMYVTLSSVTLPTRTRSCLSIDCRIKGKRNAGDVKGNAASYKGGGGGEASKQSNIAKASKKRPVTRRVERQTNNRIWLVE